MATECEPLVLPHYFAGQAPLSAGQDFFEFWSQAFLPVQQSLQSAHLQPLHFSPLAQAQSAGHGHLHPAAQLPLGAAGCGSAAMAVKHIAVAAKVRNNFFIVIIDFKFSGCLLSFGF